jgi:hypothetical protein
LDENSGVKLKSWLRVRPDLQDVTQLPAQLMAKSTTCSSSEEGTLDDLNPESFLTIWGARGRIADVLFYSNLIIKPEIKA